MAKTIIRSFTEVLGLLNRGHFAEQCDQALADALETLGNQPNEKGKGKITVEFAIEITVGAKVKRQERLASGERTVEFVEEHTNGKGERVEIPGIFMISVPAFLDGQRVRFPARLRYRIQAGTIAWFYQLYRADFWLREEVKSDLERVGDETSLPTYEGAPEA